VLLNRPSPASRSRRGRESTSIPTIQVSCSNLLPPWLRVITRNFRFSSRTALHYIPIEGFQRMIIFFGRAQGARQGPVCPNLSPATLVTAFPSGFVRHSSVPFWLWIDFPASTASAIPPGATAQRSAGAYCQTTVSSDGSPPTFGMQFHPARQPEKVDFGHF